MNKPEAWVLGFLTFGSLRPKLLEMNAVFPSKVLIRILLTPPQAITSNQLRVSSRRAHYQLPRRDSDKLVRVALGKYLDVHVDIPKDSQTYGCLENPSTITCVKIELLSGSFMSEDDIARIGDTYH